MSEKNIEIYYDIDAIPGAREARNVGKVALNFRNAAMDLIENALAEADAGEWTGAEIGSGEVNFGFTVTDFEKAEAIVRDTVAGTEFEGIRNIHRSEFSDEDLAAMQSVEMDPNFKLPWRMKLVVLAVKVLMIPLLVIFGVTVLLRRLLGRRA